MIEDVVLGLEDLVAEPVVAKELPKVLDEVEFGGASRKRQQDDVVGDDQLFRGVPAGLIEQEHGVGAGRHSCGDLFEVAGHGRRGATVHDQARAHAPGRADRPEDVGRLRALILGGRGSRSACCPTPGQGVFLADPRLVAEPDLYGFAADGLRDLRQTVGEVFSKTAAASGSWA